MPAPSLSPCDKTGRVWLIAGTVQGVGFRPWVCRLARGFGLTGRVCNELGGVRIEAFGNAAALEAMGLALGGEAPAPARVASVAVVCDEETDWAGLVEFSICESRTVGAGGWPQVAPDLAMCSECRAEIEDPQSRRFRYPFTTCARCGPRYTILENLPFDRERTSMRVFPLCEECSVEYTDPSDRRFHAQAMACPSCGPQLRWLDGDGQLLAVREDALAAAAAALRSGQVVAVKGLGGFHLMVQADNGAAVKRLRERKRRPEKPFAIMARDIAEAERLGCVGEVEWTVLESPAAPIVLLDRAVGQPMDRGRLLASEVAPGVPTIGVMLATTPLHALLLKEVAGAVVATSGNRSEEPLCSDESEAVFRLKDIADFFLSHDRPIVRRCDDSVVRILDGRVSLLRRARGYVPGTIPWDVIGNGATSCDALLGAGGHQKNAPALLVGKELLQGAHVGDLDHPLARAAWHETVSGLLELSPGTRLGMVATDAHPNYGSTIEADRLECLQLPVQHHAAHAFAAMVEAGVERACAVVWDGTGLGDDGTVWGGEFLKVERSGHWQRIGWLKPFSLPGGELAAREPARSAIGAWWEWMEGNVSAADPACARLKRQETQVAALIQALKSGIGCVRTTSAGRLFDAAAAFLGLAPRRGYEGQAAMALEQAANCVRLQPRPPRLPLTRQPGGFELDWGLAMAFCAESNDVAAAAAAWHSALIEGIIDGAHAAGFGDVLLTGGCFQNKILCDGAAHRLREEGFHAYVPRLVPMNDGGLAVGQATAIALGRFPSCTKAL